MNATPVTQTSKELVRLLVLEHGHKIAAEMSGISYDRIRQWSSRYGWKSPSQSVTNASSNLATATVDRISGTIRKNESMTRLNLSRAHRIHSVRAARGKLAPKETLQVAQAAAITHQWRNDKEKDQSNVAVNIAILNV